MSEIFEKPVKMRQILITDANRAKAIGEPIRATIIQILSKKERSIAEINEELKECGITIAPTTVRHHVDILKNAGLVELTKLKDTRGGVLKYYASNTRIIDHKPPENLEKRLEGAITETSERIIEILKDMLKTYGKEIKEVASNLKPCPYCLPEHFLEYTIIEVLNRSIAEATQSEDFKNILMKSRGTTIEKYDE